MRPLFSCEDWIECATFLVYTQKHIKGDDIPMYQLCGFISPPYFFITATNSLIIIYLFSLHIIGAMG